MDLWVRSQDKRDLMKPKHIKVVGCCIEVSDFDTCLTFASYKTKERALEVLDEIQDLLQNAYVGYSYRLVYQMPKE